MVIKLLGFIVNLWFASMLTGCIAVVAGTAAAGGYIIGKDDRSMEQIVQDATITTSVKAVLLRDSDIHGFDIDVDTYEGIVTLHGHVENRNQYDRAKKLSKSIKHVRQVKMELKIIPLEVEERR